MARHFAEGLRNVHLYFELPTVFSGSRPMATDRGTGTCVLMEVHTEINAALPLYHLFFLR